MSENEGEATGFKVLSAADRIRELNEIDQDIASIPRNIGLAIGVLGDENATDKTLEEQQRLFSEHSAAQFTALANVEARLRRQIYALEEAGLVPAGDKVRDAKKARTLADEELVRRAGGGPLDSSWLKARSRDTVGKSLKKETLDAMKVLLKEEGIDVGKDEQKDNDMLIDQS